MNYEEKAEESPFKPTDEKEQRCKSMYIQIKEKGKSYNFTKINMYHNHFTGPVKCSVAEKLIS